MKEYRGSAPAEGNTVNRNIFRLRRIITCILMLNLCSFVNDVRPEKAKEFCLWRIDFSDGGRA